MVNLSWTHVVLLTLAMLCGPVAANDSMPTLEEMARLVEAELWKQYATDEQLDAAIAKTYKVQLPAQQARVARETLRTILRHEAVPIFMAKILLPIWTPDITPKQVTRAVMEGILQLQGDGVARLSVARQAAFVRHVIDLARALPPAQCKAMYLGQMNTEQGIDAERRYIAALPPGKFDAITNLYREAVEAELSGYPDARTINADQAKLAEQAYQAASAKRLRGRVPQAVIQRAHVAPAVAPAHEVCEVISTSAEGMLDLSEPYRSWQLARFVSGLK